MFFHQTSHLNEEVKCTELSPSVIIPLPRMNIVIFIITDMLQRLRSSPPLLSGPDLVRLMHVGTRVVRGADWKWGDQVLAFLPFLKSVDICG